MTENPTVLDNVLGWLHEGYPEGVPPKDYFPLLALLKRSLTEEEVVKAAQIDPEVDRLRRGDRSRDPHGGPRRDRQGTQPGGDPPGRVAAGLRRLAARSPLAEPPDALGSVSRAVTSGVAAQRVVLGYLDEDQQDAVGIDDMHLVQSPRFLRCLAGDRRRRGPAAPSRRRTRRGPEATSCRPRSACRGRRVRSATGRRKTLCLRRSRGRSPGRVRRGRTAASARSRPAG